MWPTLASISDPVAEKREPTRSWLAYGVTGLLGLVAITLIIWGLVRDAQLDTVLTGVFTPLIGIAGTVIGFILLARRKNRHKLNPPGMDQQVPRLSLDPPRK
jgi:hypothetical protein